MLTARQHAAFRGFEYDLFDAGGQRAGTLRWPALAVATNGRLRALASPEQVTNVRFDWFEAPYEIDFTFLRRGWTNDVRFTLKGGGMVLAEAEALQPPGLLARSKLSLTAPFAATLVPAGSILKARYELRRDGVLVGTVAERGGLTVRRELRLLFPDGLAAPIQVFLLFLVCNRSYR